MSQVPPPADDSHLHEDLVARRDYYRRAAEHYWNAVARRPHSPYRAVLLQRFEDADASARHYDAMVRRGESEPAF